MYSSLAKVTIIIVFLLLVLLSIIAIEGNVTPLVLFLIMFFVGVFSIIVFSNKNDYIIKVYLFILFFSIYLIYKIVQHYLLLSLSPYQLPFVLHDELTFYNFSNFGLPYISGQKNILDLVYDYKLGVYELPLHVMISSSITYLAHLIDGQNSILVQKMLAPFLGGLTVVVLHSILKYEFNKHNFVLKATIAYGLFSALFTYATPMLRDIDIALTYMIFIYLFLQPTSSINFFLLFLISYVTIFLRVESGMILMAIILIYGHMYAKSLKLKLAKLILYIFVILIISVVMASMYSSIIKMIVGLEESKINTSTMRASQDSIGILLNKLPFGISHIAKVSFGQLQLFPFFTAVTIDFRAAINGLFWPFIDIMMFFAIIKRKIRVLIPNNILYLLLMAMVVLFLMSSEPMTRRMLSVYPIIYIVALYAINSLTNNEIKRVLFYYSLGMIILNVLYAFIKY